MSLEKVDLNYFRQTRNFLPELNRPCGVTKSAMISAGIWAHKRLENRVLNQP